MLTFTHLDKLRRCCVSPHADIPRTTSPLKPVRGTAPPVTMLWITPRKQILTSRLRFFRLLHVSVFPPACGALAHKRAAEEGPAMAPQHQSPCKNLCLRGRQSSCRARLLAFCGVAASTQHPPSRLKNHSSVAGGSMTENQGIDSRTDKAVTVPDPIRKLPPRLLQTWLHPTRHASLH